VGISKIQRLGGTRMMSLAEAIDCEHENRLLKKAFAAMTATP
jgi:hypothetical protein